MLLICWGCCTKCPTLKMLVSYLQTSVQFHWNFPPDHMNKQQPSRSAFVLKLCTAHRLLLKGLTPECTWLIEEIFVDLLITATISAAFDSYLWYSLTRMLNTEDGGNTSHRNIRNCVMSQKNRTISNTADRTWNHTKLILLSLSTSQFSYPSSH